MIISGIGAEYGINCYRNIQSEKSDSTEAKFSCSGASNSASGTKHKKSDRIDFSGQKSTENRTFPGEIKKDILADLAQNTDPARLSSLKNRVSSGRYSVDSNEMARILSE